MQVKRSRDTPLHQLQALFQFPGNGICRPGLLAHFFEPINTLHWQMLQVYILSEYNLFVRQIEELAIKLFTFITMDNMTGYI
jgi:hypothetical protein